MPEIGFNTSNPFINQLVHKGAGLVQDKTLSEGDQSELKAHLKESLKEYKLDLKDQVQAGTLSSQAAELTYNEAKDLAYEFVTQLKFNLNITVLNETLAGLNLSSEVNLPEKEFNFYRFDNTRGQSPVKSAEISDQGKALTRELDDYHVTSTSLRQEVVQQLSQHSSSQQERQALLTNFRQFDATFAQAKQNYHPTAGSTYDSGVMMYKEVMLYSRELLNRQPPLQASQLNQIFQNFNALLDPEQTPFQGSANLDLDFRKELVASALTEVALPENISQGHLGTCAMTAIQIKMAIEQPAQYIDMVCTLCQGNSYADIPPDYGAFRDRNNNGIRDGLKGRSLTSALVQDSLMDYGWEKSGKTQDYNSSSLERSANYGSSMKAQVAVMNQLFSGSGTFQSFDTDDYSAAQIAAILEDVNPSPQEPLQIGMRFSQNGGNHALHAVGVTNIDQASGNVTYINPWGQEETISNQDFYNRVIGFVSSYDSSTIDSTATLDKTDFTRQINNHTFTSSRGNALRSDGASRLTQFIENNNERFTLDQLRTLTSRMKSNKGRPYYDTQHNNFKIRLNSEQFESIKSALSAVDPRLN